MTTILRVRCAPPIFACAAGLVGFLSMGAADALPGEDYTSQLQEIVVTAQKRPQNIQDVPISIVSLSADTLDKSGVISTGDIQHLASGLNISTVGSGFVSYTYIRGGGSNQVDPGSDPSVAYFLDEVYLGGSAGLAFDLVDIDHVEVLKGPRVLSSVATLRREPSASRPGHHPRHSAVLWRLTRVIMALRMSKVLSPDPS